MSSALLDGVDPIGRCGDPPVEEPDVSDELLEKAVKAMLDDLRETRGASGDGLSLESVSIRTACPSDFCRGSVTMIPSGYSQIFVLPDAHVRQGNCPSHLCTVGQKNCDKIPAQRTFFLRLTYANKERIFSMRTHSPTC
jgi:hypothetical protein